MTQEVQGAGAVELGVHVCVCVCVCVCEHLCLHVHQLYEYQRALVLGIWSFCHIL